MTAERDAEGEMLRNFRPGGGGEDVGFEVVDEMACVCGSTVVAAKHVLCMPWIPLLPRFVVQFVDLSASVITLVKGYGDQTLWVLACSSLADSAVPC